MGLKEQIAAGVIFERSTAIFTTDVVGYGSIQIAPTYTILSIQSDKSIRLRLYDNETSLLDAGEIARGFTNTAVSNSIALIADISMSSGLYTIDPAVYGVSENPTTPLTYYRVENDSQATILINYFPIESNKVTPAIGTAYSLNNRRTLAVSKSVAFGEKPFVSRVGTGVPNTYLLISASLDDPTHIARLRLYASLKQAVGTEDPLIERNRPISTEPPPEIPLIVDMIISGSETMYFTPKIIGSNIQTLHFNGSEAVNRNLFDFRTNPTLLNGINRFDVVVENLGPTSPASITASFHVYVLEE